jgi:hypothetical protein
MILDGVYLLLIITLSVSVIPKPISEKPSDEKDLPNTFFGSECFLERIRGCPHRKYFSCLLDGVTSPIAVLLCYTECGGLIWVILTNKYFSKLVFPTGFANRYCQQVLPIIVFDSFFNRFCRQVLPTGFADRFFQKVLPTVFANWVKQHKTKQDKTKQSQTKQSKTKQNKVKPNKEKYIILQSHGLANATCLVGWLVHQLVSWLVS